MKLPTRSVLVVIAVLVVAGFVASLGLGSIVKRAIEGEGTKSLSLSTTVSRAHVSLLGGKLKLSELRIASPRGFSAPQMLELGNVGIAVHYGELRRDPVHIDSLTLDRPRLVIEQSNGAVNFRKAMDLQPAGDPGKPPMKVVIGELKMEDAQVVIRPGLPGVAQEIVVPVPSLTLRNVGQGQGAKNGAAIKEVAMQVIAALAGSAAQSGALPAPLKALLNVDVAAVAGKLGAEARKQIAAALPGEAGATLSKAVQDPAALAKDPVQALQGLKK